MDGSSILGSTWCDRITKVMFVCNDSTSFDFFDRRLQMPEKDFEIIVTRYLEDNGQTMRMVSAPYLCDACVDVNRKCYCAV